MRLSFYKIAGARHNRQRISGLVLFHKIPVINSVRRDVRRAMRKWIESNERFRKLKKSYIVTFQKDIDRRIFQCIVEVTVGKQTYLAQSHSADPTRAFSRCLRQVDKNSVSSIDPMLDPVLIN